MKNFIEAEKIEQDFRLHQYRDLENWDKLFSVISKRYEALRIFLKDMARLIWHIDSAEGAQLDNISAIHGIERPPGLNDRAYRMVLRQELQLFRNLSGTFPELHELALIYTGDPEPLILQEHPFGSIVFFTPDGQEIDTAFFDTVTAAGILPLAGNYFELAEEENGCFQFSDGDAFLLAGEAISEASSLFLIYFELSETIEPRNFIIAINNYTLRRGSLEISLYNLNGEIDWKFESNSAEFENAEGGFSVIDGIFEYNVFVELRRRR